MECTRRGSSRRRAIAGALAFAALAGGVAAAGPSAPASAAAAQLFARGGTGEITVAGAARAEVALYDAHGTIVPTLDATDPVHLVRANTRHIDDHGRLVLRYVAPGAGYTVRRVDTKLASNTVTVRSFDENPEPGFYAKQQLTEGFGYLRTRDGTQLSYMLRLPGPIEDGPYPTIVEYSGYDPSNPYQWSGTAPSTHVASVLGYAVIGVNLRGSGCSGGSFDVFEPIQSVDGYDVIETVAAQPWVLNHKVGMAGLSYPGQMALLTATRRPPSLAGIAVGGTQDDAFRFTLRPGGLLNTGFTRAWVAGRYADSIPETAPGWVKQRIAEGDAQCRANMAIRYQSVAVLPYIDTTPWLPTDPPGLAESLAASEQVAKITVPVLLIATWQDEQVGGHTPSMLSRFTGTTKKHFILTNGGHAEMFAIPEVLQRWDEFFTLYVRRDVPNEAAMRFIAPVVNQSVLGSPNPLALPFPADRFTGKTYAEALAAFESDPQVQVMFENGAGQHGTEAGLPDPAFSSWFPAYPVPGTTATRWWFGANGALQSSRPTATDAADSYVSDPSVRPTTSLPGGGEWGQLPNFDWAPPVTGDSLTYLSPAMTSDTTMVGSGSADFWLRSSRNETDVQVTLTEVRPDGKETYVQSGFLRSTARALDPMSTTLQPIPSLRKEDFRPLPAGQFTKMRVEIFPFAHVFRAGSKVRVIISAPGGDRVSWSFALLAGTQTNEIARTSAMPSSIVLPVVPGVAVPTGLPACPGLRAQPCRDYTGAS